MTETPQLHRIPYDAWINSHLSIARHYGGCTVNGKHYRLGYDNAPKRMVNGEERLFPDLVEVVKPTPKPRKKKDGAK